MGRERITGPASARIRRALKLLQEGGCPRQPRDLGKCWAELSRREGGEGPRWLCQLCAGTGAEEWVWQRKICRCFNGQSLGPLSRTNAPLTPCPPPLTLSCSSRLFLPLSPKPVRRPSPGSRAAGCRLSAPSQLPGVEEGTHPPTSAPQVLAWGVAGR